MVVYLATADVDEPDDDREFLSEALRAASIPFAWPRWDDPEVDWSHATVCYPRATWDYHTSPDRFVTWMEHVDAVSQLRNPLEVIRWNLDKRYLLDLADRGLPVVPTEVVEQGADTSLDEVRRARGWDRVVVKPAVSCGSWNTYALRDPADVAPWADLVAERVMLVQPYVDSVDSTGERSAIVIDGEVTHVMRKAPRFAGGVEATMGPFEPSDVERAFAAQALGAIGVPLDYARVDMVLDADGAPMLAELELIEPSLFFRHNTRALQLFLNILRRFTA